MAQKLDSPKTERDLRELQDTLYALAKKGHNEQTPTGFKNLLEAISSPVTISMALGNLRANKGSSTPGTDRQTLSDIMNLEAEVVICDIQNSIFNYHPVPVRRVWIPKPGKSEKRPLGIPTIKDRIIQECFRIILEPIFEAQFFAHSYGFRPMRNTHNAIARITNLLNRTNCHWAVEGDISKFFDTIHHPTMIRLLWHYGIRDRRVLMAIKAMLKAGIMGECTSSSLGTPQGGIISPLLANIYLHHFDMWVAKQWECKQTQREYKDPLDGRKALRRKSNLKPAFLVRYADDWILLTDSQENAEKWKFRINQYLESRLHLRLSTEKTHITNLNRHPARFLGFTIRRKDYGNKKLASTSVDHDRIKPKIKRLHLDITKLRHQPTAERIVLEIHRINSVIRGLVNYYCIGTTAYRDFKRYSRNLQLAGFRSLRRWKNNTWVSAKETDNLPSVHCNYSEHLPTFIYMGSKIAITALHFVKFEAPTLKTQEESPYTVSGRELYWHRQNKKPLETKCEELSLNGIELYHSIRKSKHDITRYNLEYFLDRIIAFKRDKGRCKVCGEQIFNLDNLETHHVAPTLPRDLLNKTKNLSSLHMECHEMIHGMRETIFRSTSTPYKRIQGFRKKLGK